MFHEEKKKSDQHGTSTQNPKSKRTKIKNQKKKRKLNKIESKRKKINKRIDNDEKEKRKEKRKSKIEEIDRRREIRFCVWFRSTCQPVFQREISFLREQFLFFQLFFFLFLSFLTPFFFFFSLIVEI